MKVKEIHTSLGASLDAAKKQDIVEQDSVTVIEKSRRQGETDEVVTKTESNEASSEWEECRIIVFFLPERGCALHAKAQVTARVDVFTAPRQCCGFLSLDSLRELTGLNDE